MVTRHKEVAIKKLAEEAAEEKQDWIRYFGRLSDHVYVIMKNTTILQNLDEEVSDVSKAVTHIMKAHPSLIAAQNSSQLNEQNGGLKTEPNAEELQ